MTCVILLRASHSRGTRGYHFTMSHLYASLNLPTPPPPPGLDPKQVMREQRQRIEQLEQHQAWLIARVDVLEKSEKRHEWFVQRTDVLERTLESVRENQKWLIDQLEALRSRRQRRHRRSPSPRARRYSGHLCHHCGETFHRRYALDKHLQVEHQTHAQVRCNKCDERFVFSRSLDTHRDKCPGS